MNSFLYFLKESKNEIKCTECPKQCTNCTTSSIEYCTDCLEGQYYDNALKECKQCVSPCLECNKTVCFKCQFGYSLINSQCEKKCQRGQYYKNSQCYNCMENCNDCTQSDVCDLCKQGFKLYKGKCHQVCPLNTLVSSNKLRCLDCVDNPDLNSDCTEKEKCGDGKRIQDQCDDGNNDDGDGCSSKCKIEDGFECKGGSPTSKDTCKKIAKLIDAIIDKKDLNFQIIVDKDYKKDDTHIKIDFYKKSIKQPTENVELALEIEGVNSKQYDYELVFNCQDQLYDITLKKVEFQSFETKQVKVKFLTKITDTDGNSLNAYEQIGDFPPTVKISEQTKKQADAAKQVGQQVVNAMLTSSLLIILAGNFYLIVNIIDIAEIIYFLIFINTKYPFNLMIYFRIFKNFQLSFLPDLFSWMMNEEGEDSPVKFQEEGMGSYFLSNTGESFTCFIIVSSLYLVIILASKKFKFFQNLRKSFELNKFLEAVWTVYLNIMISCFLQIQNIKSDGSFKDIFNLIFCFICFLFFITCPIYFNYIILSNDLEEDKKFQQKYSSLWEGLHINTKLNKSFNVILYYRKIYFSLVIVFLHDYTNIQIGLLCLHNFILANIIFIKKPALHFKENLKNFLSEVLLFIGEAFIYQMHNMQEDDDQEEQEEKIIFGWVVISLLSMILLIHFISILHDVFIIVKTFIIEWRNRKKKNQIRADENNKQVEKQMSNDQVDQQKIINFKVDELIKQKLINSQLINSASGSNSMNIISDQQLQTKSTKDFYVVQNNLSKQNIKSQQQEQGGLLIRMTQSSQRKISGDSDLSQQVLDNQQPNNIKQDFDIESLIDMTISKSIIPSKENQNIQIKNTNFQMPQSKSANKLPEKIQNITSLQRIMSQDQKETQQINKNQQKGVKIHQSFVGNSKNMPAMFTRGQQKKMTAHIEKVKKSLVCIENFDEDENEESFKKNIDQSIYNQSINNNQSISLSQQLPKILINSIQPLSLNVLDLPQEEISSFANSMTNSRTNIVLQSSERNKKKRNLPFTQNHQPK